LSHGNLYLLSGHLISSRHDSYNKSCTCWQADSQPDRILKKPMVKCRRLANINIQSYCFIFEATWKVESLVNNYYVINYHVTVHISKRQIFWSICSIFNILLYSLNNGWLQKCNIRQKLQHKDNIIIKLHCIGRPANESLAYQNSFTALDSLYHRIDAMRSPKPTKLLFTKLKQNYIGPTSLPGWRLPK